MKRNPPAPTGEWVVVLSIVLALVLMVIILTRGL